MPNIITILTLLPVLKVLKEELQPVLKEQTSTVLAMAAIWGANIGGMGSMVGSPANVLLIGFLEIYQIAGREQINFLNWFAWGVPLATLFLVFAWGILRIFMIPKISHTDHEISIHIKAYEWKPEQTHVLFIFLGFIFFWVLESIIESLTPNQYGAWKTVLSLVYFSVFIAQTFIFKQKAEAQSGLGEAPKFPSRLAVRHAS